MSSDVFTGFFWRDSLVYGDRRRVTCCDVSCFGSDVPLPFESAGRPDKPMFSSSKETSSIVVEKKDEITASLGASGSRSMHDVADAGAQLNDVAAAAAASVLPDASKTNTVVVCVCLHLWLSHFILSK